jgi:UV DNA damage endonuclease
VQPRRSERRGATEQAIATWNRLLLFHISRPINGGRDRPYAERHHDYVDVKDFPKCWDDPDVTVEVEARQKELAVLKVAKDLPARSSRRTENIWHTRP